MEHDRAEHDYYATEPKAMNLLLEKEIFKNVWECACGEGHLSKVLEANGCLSRESDLVSRSNNCETFDFLQAKNWDGDIITNPPYSKAKEFVEKAIDIIFEGNKVAMFLKLTFLEGQKRRKMFDKIPPKIVYVSSARLKCALNGNFNKTGSSAAAYAWFVWVKGFKGDPIIKWIN